jgi:hypothetical protein
MLWAMAGAAIVVAAATPAAPTPAVLMNFLRCMISLSSRGCLHGPLQHLQHWHAKLTLKSARLPENP